jgi:HlyD family secretion protein
VLTRLDNEATLAAAVASAQAAVAAQAAVLGQTRAAVAASASEARADLARAEAALVNAGSEFERVQELFDRGVATQSDLDARRATRDQVAQDVERARAALGRYDVGDLDAQPDVLVAARNLDAARADLHRAERDLDTAVVRAPISGTVLKLHVRVGERPRDEGLMDLADLSRMTAEVEVYQSEIGRVAPGAPVTLTAEALPVPLKGTVARIGLEVGRQTLVGADPAANTDARVVEVTVALDEPSTALAQRFTNLQVIGRIEVGGVEASDPAELGASGAAP